MISAAPSISIETVPAAGTGVGVGVEAGISKLVTAELSGVTPPAGPKYSACREPSNRTRAASSLRA